MNPARLLSLLTALLGLLSPALPGEAGEVASPLFFDSEGAFLHHVDEGEFSSLLELHLAEYSADPGWPLEWAASRYADSGFFVESGSTGSRSLYTGTRVALNAFPSDRLQLRYDLRIYQDDRFDVYDQRFDALWYPTGGWAVMVSGWPVRRKEEASLGLGARLGAPGGRNGVTLLLLDERFFWNQKAEGGVRYAKQPLRLLADGSRELGRWAFYGSVDYGLAYRAEEDPAQGGVQDRSTAGYLRFATLGAEVRGEGWAAGGQTTLMGSRFEQGHRDGTGYVLERVYGRVQVYGRVESGRLAGYGLAEVAWQRDDFSSSGSDEATYRMGTWLVGAEGGYRVLDPLELRLGYLGSVFSMERGAFACAGTGACLVGRDEAGYADKAHLRAIYDLRPRMSIEFLLSQTVTGPRFGGGSVKALVVF